jgi:hypothetical protein
VVQVEEEVVQVVVQLQVQILVQEIHRQLVHRKVIMEDNQFQKVVVQVEVQVQ